MNHNCWGVSESPYIYIYIYPYMYIYIYISIYYIQYIHIYIVYIYSVVYIYIHIMCIYIMCIYIYISIYYIQYIHIYIVSIYIYTYNVYIYIMYICVVIVTVYPIVTVYLIVSPLYHHFCWWDPSHFLRLYNLNYPIVIVLCTLTYTYIHSTISPIVHYHIIHHHSTLYLGNISPIPICEKTGSKQGSRMSFFWT